MESRPGGRRPACHKKSLLVINYSSVVVFRLLLWHPWGSSVLRQPPLMMQTQPLHQKPWNLESLLRFFKRKTDREVKNYKSLALPTISGSGLCTIKRNTTSLHSATTEMFCLCQILTSLTSWCLALFSRNWAWFFSTYIRNSSFAKLNTDLRDQQISM